MIRIKYWGFRLLTWTILFGQPEEKIYVSQINFMGNEHIKDGLLEKTINLKKPKYFNKTAFDRRILKLDAITIKNQYRMRGFLEVAVKDSFVIEEETAHLYFIINEGRQIYIQDILLTGNSLVKRKKILAILGLKKDTPYNPVMVKKNLKVVEKFYHKIGKLFANIEVQKSIKDSVKILINIDEGPDIKINNTYFDGVNKTDSLIVFRELVFEKNDLFNIDEIYDSQRFIMESNLFSLVNIYPVKSIVSDSMVNMVVEVRYFPKREISSEGGLVPIEYGGLLLSGPGVFIQWKDRSLFGTTTRLSARSSLEIPTEAGFRYPRFSIDLDFENQWLFILRFPTKLRSLYEVYKKYGESEKPFIQRYGFHGSTINNLSETSYVEFKVSWEKFNQQEQGTRDVEQRSMILKTKLDYSDRPIFPRKGIILTGSATGVGGPLGGNRHYEKIDFGVQYYIPLPRKTVLAARIKYGMIFGWKDEYDLFEDILFEKFYLGGTKTLRGWKALQFPNTQKVHEIFLNGNELRLLMNVELRFPIIWQIGGEVFADGGWLGGEAEALLAKNLKWNLGGGITYTSPLGPMRLDYAFQVDKPENWEILLDVLYAF